MRFSLSMLALALLAPLPSLAATAAKDATAATLASNQQWLKRLSFEDRVDYETARRGLVERFDGPVATADGKTVWNLAQYAFLEPAQSPATVNPSLWRVAQLNNIAGLFKVTEGIYQLRGLDLANMTIVEGPDGLIVLDPLLAVETAKAGLELYFKHRPPQAGDHGDLHPPARRPFRRRARGDQRGGRQGWQSTGHRARGVLRTCHR